VTPYKYNWFFGDSSTGFWRIISHIYTGTWLYQVTLSVTDNTDATADATALIKVIENKCENDSDADWIGDCEDLCPIIKGDSENKWCPILEIKCENDGSCPTGYQCQKENLWVWVCLPESLETSCVYSWGSVVFGNAVSLTCPSKVFLDFNAPLRKCDTVFPAITSPDHTNIYSKGKWFEIK
jgi:hypothetical protein